MPKLNNNLLDDPIVSDICPGFAGGQHSSSAANRLSLQESAELLNIDIRSGAATTRRGTEAVGAALPAPIQGLCWFETTETEHLVAAAGGQLFHWDESSWESFSTYDGSPTGEQVSFAQLGAVLYIADGVTPLTSWDGSETTEVDAPVGSILIGASNRLWLGGLPDEPDTLRASKPIAATVWDAGLLSLRIGGDGDPITGLTEWDDHQIVVFKRNSIYLVRADPALTSGEDEATALARATVTKVSDRIGCVAPRSIAHVGADVWFLADSGVYQLGRTTASTDRTLKEAVSAPVQDMLQRLNGSAAHRAAACVWEHRYLLSLPLDSAIAPDHVLVFDVLRNAWSGFWTGCDAIMWVQSKAGGQPRLDFGRPDGSVRRWLDYLPAGSEVESTYQDAGTNIATRLLTRAMNLGDELSEKSGLSIQAEFHRSEASATVAVTLDEDEPFPLATDVATSAGSIILPALLPARLPRSGTRRRSFGTHQLHPFRALQAVITSPAGKLSIRGVSVTGFIDSVRLEE